MIFGVVVLFIGGGKFGIIGVGVVVVVLLVVVGVVGEVFFFGEVVGGLLLGLLFVVLLSCGKFSGVVVLEFGFLLCSVGVESIFVSSVSVVNCFIMFYFFVLFLLLLFDCVGCDGFFMLVRIV